MTTRSTVEPLTPDVAKAVSASRRLVRMLDTLSESYTDLTAADRCELSALQGRMAAVSHRLDVAREDSQK